MKRVLVVEDDSISAAGLRHIMQKEGYEVWLDTCGEDAIERIREGQVPDIIMMDIDLGQNCLDGAQATDEIHRLYDIPVVLHTGYVDAETFARAAAMTKYGYVYKTPGNAQFVLASIETALKLHAAERAVREREQQYRDLSKHLQDIREKQSALIAREIHDDLGQSLAALKMNLSLMGERLDSQQRVVVDDMHQILDQAVDRMRALINNLRPPVLDTSGIVEALRWHLEEFQRSFHLPVTINVEPELEELELDQDAKLCIFRIVQEALTNCAKHAGAQKASVELACKGDSLVVSVTDNGCGFEKGKGGFGLLGMKERAEVVGGHLVIDSQLQKGTSVVLSLPKGSLV